MNRPLWTPAQERLRRVRGWYDASLAPSMTLTENVGDPPRVLSEWSDISGFGNNLSRSYSVYRPEMGRINGKRSVMVRQSGAESITALAAAGNPYSVTNASGFVMLCVFRPDAVDFGGTINDGGGTYVWDRKGDTPRSAIFSLKADSTFAWRLQARGDGSGGLASSPNLFPVVVGKLELVSLRFHYDTAINTSVWRDGLRVYHTDNPGTGPTSPELPCFGKDDFITATDSRVNVGEWIIINDAADTRLRQRIEGYLAHKWGVRLASGHPYAFAPPMVGAAPSPWPNARYTSASISVTARKVFGWVPTLNPRLPIIR